MKIYILIFALILLCTSQAGEGADQAEANEQEKPSQEEIQRFYSMRRTACIVLSRNYVNSRKDEVDEIFNGLDPEQQPSFANKLYSTGVEICEQHIAPNQVQEMFVQNENFDVSIYFPLFATYDIVGISKNSFKLTKPQEHILQSIKQFDDDMAIRKEEQESEESKEDSDKYDIKLFNISTKDMSPLAKSIYALVFFGLIAGLLFWGFKHLDAPETKKKDKKKKESSPSRNSRSPKRA